MFWPSQGIWVFAAMAAVPPLVALLCGHVSAATRSLPISLLAAVLAAFTRLVPLAIVLLFVSAVVALRQLSPVDLPPAWRRVKPLLLATPFVWLGGYLVWVYLSNNWSPPPNLEQALLETRTLERDQALTASLQARFPDGTDETVVKASLVAEGFGEVKLLQAQCRTPQAGQSFELVPCPYQPRQMSYTFRRLSLCGVTLLTVDWQVDPAGKARRVHGRDATICW